MADEAHIAGLVIPFPGWDESNVPRIQATVSRAYEDEFGAIPEVRTRQIEIGRGGDAGAVLVEFLQWAALVYGVAVGPADLVKKGREAFEEYRSWAQRVASFVERLRDAGARPTVLSANWALLVTISDLENRAGPVNSLVWWDEIVIQQFEWVDDPARLDSTAERLYFYVFETDQARWFVATKADGAIVTEAETMIPGDYVEYALWRRHAES